MKSEPTIIFLLKENKTFFSLICAPFSICGYNDFFLLSSSHSLMKMLNKTGFCRGPQGPSTTYFPSGLIAVYHNFFFFPTHSSAVFNSCDGAPMQVNLN